ncbi:SMI1/KNR4 family protein [Laribacter hongkongensis]|uniref:SMI1/KNR4 family protein n=1 Tax=Laribacter hongkongensis TaxID=168471 RepID=UPI001EFD74B9|nr:SMI1/KNR4 family protein [Laribacter hongkongensis]MCG9060230.1 SMI1/KNR4 family protein [Laribacter hongkongensis]MCG9087327.1 SMI1/KNR4 family protein [Laribacter hongkongensis]
MHVTNKGPKLKFFDINELEADFSIKLPGDYREFLLLNNGGTLNQNKNTIDILNMADSPTDVQVLFGIGRGVASSNINWNIELIRDYGENTNLVPFACDSGGGLFCLMASNNNYEVVYFDINSPDKFIYSIANGFSEFLKMIRSF